MSKDIPFSEKKLKEWAGYRAYRDGQSLFTRKAVEKVKYEPPLVSGFLNLGPRGMRSRFEILRDGFVENHCPCRDNQDRGLICSHLVAMGLALIYSQRDAGTDRSDRKEAERRKRRSNKEGVSGWILDRDATDAVAARLYVELDERWQEQLAQDAIRIRLFVDHERKREPLEQVLRDTPLAFSARDEEIFTALGSLFRHELKSVICLSREQLTSVLRIFPGRALHVQGKKKGIMVNRSKVESELLLDLDPETGELLLGVQTIVPAAGDESDEPAYLIGENAGWFYCFGKFWPLETLLPRMLREVYQGGLVIRRTEVPLFLMTELPQVEKTMTVCSSISSELFTMKPAMPVFRLLLKGSPASLSATLYATYSENIELVAGRADMRGNFAIPDASDLLRYRIRNMEAEKRAVKELVAVGFEGRAGDTLRNIVGHQEVLNFLGSGIPRIRRKGWTVELEGRIEPFVKSTEYVRPVVRVSEDATQDYFDVSYDYEVSEGSISEREIQHALMNGDSFVEHDGRTVLLDVDAVTQAKEFFKDCSLGEGGSSGSIRMKGIYGSYVQSSLGALDAVELRATDDWFERARQYQEQTTIEPVELSPKLNVTLRSYQQEGVNWLRFLETRGFCGILADEMGLGKTLQALAWVQLERVHEEARGRPVLVVCPTSLVENWYEEASRFTPDLKVIMLHGTERHGLWKKVPKADVVITSYALMRRDIDRLLEHTYSIAILDEAQHIKNRSTQNALAVKRIQAIHRLVLSGTPIENGVTDLWSIMDFLMPGYLGAHQDFHEFYELPIVGGGEMADYVQAKLRRKLHPFLLRRMKKQVAKDLPPKIERIAPCKLTADQHRVYMQLLEDSRRQISNMVSEQGFNKSRMEILKTLLRLRQTCCHIDLLNLEGIESEYPSAKMELFFELLAEATDASHRVLVFSQFTSMLAILRKEMEARGLKYCYLDGSTKDRQSVVKQFNRDKAIPVFLMSLKAGGTGLNLTGADMVIHFDPWWNPAVEDQATDRAHRIGQKRTVYSVKLIAKGTVEEKVVALQQRKKGIIDATLTTDEQVMQHLTWEDVQELLSL